MPKAQCLNADLPMEHLKERLIIKKYVLANLLSDAERSWEIVARLAPSPQMQPQMKVDVTEDDKVYHVKAAIHSMAKCHQG